MKGSGIKQERRNEYRQREKEELGDSKTTKAAVAMAIKRNVRHEYKHESLEQRSQRSQNRSWCCFSDTQKYAHFADVPEYLRTLASECYCSSYARMGKEGFSLFDSSYSVAFSPLASYTD
jgi:hypothetical protein